MASLGDNLYGVWGTGPDNVYAVGGEFETQGGYGGTVGHYKPVDGGLTWTYEQSMFYAGAELSFKDVAGTAPDRVFTIGQWFNPGNPPSLPPSGGNFDYEWDGGGWAATSPGFNVALFGSPQTDMWATSTGVGGTIIAHFENGAWATKLTAPLGDTYGAIWAGGAHAFVLGSSYQSDGGSTTFIEHFDGTTWQKTASPAQLSGIWGSSPTDVFAVGAGGTVLHYDGTAWTEQPSGTTKDLGTIWGSSPYDVFALGAGTVFHYQGDVWTEEELPDAGYTYYLADIWGSGPGDIFAVGYKGIVLHRSP
jgi:hypothetical protein